jgi:hypothetical protein
LFAADTHANPLATPAKETAPTTQDTSGQCLPNAFAWFDHDSHCWKTLQGTFLSDSEMSKPIWPRSGTTHNGIAYQRQPSAHRTSATEYSLSLHGNMEWTPTATANQMAPSMRQRNPGLRLWPTPLARDHKGVGMKGQLPTTVSQWEGSGSLNPEWVEWLMGFPIGWTDLED